jgi:hypothetical protein
VHEQDQPGLGAAIDWRKSKRSMANRQCVEVGVSRAART